MPLLHWQPSYLLEIEEFDRQHKFTFELINRISSCVMQNKKADEIEALFYELLCFSMFHFRCEEEFIKSKTGHESWSHILEHHRLILELKALQERVCSDRRLPKIEEMRQLHRWQIDHLLRYDKKIIQLQSPQQQSPPRDPGNISMSSNQ